METSTHVDGNEITAQSEENKDRNEITARSEQLLCNKGWTEERRMVRAVRPRESIMRADR